MNARGEPTDVGGAGGASVVALVNATEDWFVRNGIPHFIDDFKASEDVWTRAVGFLTLVFLAELTLTFGSDVRGWWQFAAFVSGATLVLASLALVNRLRGLPAFTRPRTIGAGELALFVLVPPVLAWLGGSRAAEDFVVVVAVNVAILALTYLVISWGLLSMARWGIATMWRHLTQVAQLLGRTLPLMLLFSAFLFLNAEIWQVVNDLPLALFAVVLAMLALIGAIFLSGAMRGAIQELRFFTEWSDVAVELENTPLAVCDPTAFAGKPRRVPLGRAGRLNLTLRLVVGLSAQVLLVTLLIFGFYVLFGVLTVREDTILQWTTREAMDGAMLVNLSIGEIDLVLTTLHLVTAGFVAAFSGLQFAVSLVTDEAYKEEFVRESNDEVRQALAVRAAYLRLRSPERV